MRVLLVGMIAALAAGCVYTVRAPVPQTEGVFASQRGTALPPPAASSGTAPPQGVAAGGVDFGQWRSADPAAYAPAFQTQMRQRLAGKSRTEAAADLQANGFSCENGSRGLDCRIEIMESQCAIDWYVVLEAGRAEPVAGFDKMCLGAQ